MINVPTLDINEDNLKRLKEERDLFQRVIGGGRWNLNHTLHEIFKILDRLDKSAKVTL